MDGTDAHEVVALVTGANKGIGFETALQLGRLGIVVLVGARDAAARTPSSGCGATASGRSSCSST